MTERRDAAGNQQRTLAQRIVYRLARRVAQLTAVGVFRIRMEGRHYIPVDGPVLVCSNHQSYFDPVIVGLGCRRRLNYLARKTLFRHPVFRYLIYFFDAIAIDRDGMGVEGIKETLRRLKREEMVLMFPEGTRTHDGELRALRPGFCALARRGKTTLLPVAIDGAYQCWPRQNKWPRLDRLALVFGPPITAEDMAQWDNEQLVAELAERMADCHRRARQLRATHVVANQYQC